MDLLNQVYFDNTIRSYCVVSGTIIFAIIFKRYLSNYLVSLFFLFVKRIWKTVSKQSFKSLIAVPFEWFIVIFVAVFAIDKLTFPQILLFTLYGHTTLDILGRLGTGVIIVSFIWLVLRITDFIALVLEEKANVIDDVKDNQLIVFLRDFIKVIIGVIGILLIVKACFRQPLGNLLTGLSLVGAALALGAKESLENLIASFIIFFDKPFFAGDTVKVNNITGKVIKIGLRSTRILTGDKSLVTMPNKQMVDSIVDNLSMRSQRRAEIKLDLSVKTTAANIEIIIAGVQTILENNADLISPYSVFLKDISKNGITLMVEYFTPATAISDFDALKQKISIQIKLLLEQNAAEFTSEVNPLAIDNK